MAETRLPRGFTPRSETRESEERPKQWKPASMLPSPNPQPGWRFRWVRKATMGQDDPTNMSRMLREGWEVCKAEDYPELRMSIDAGSSTVENGGLILCKMPEEMAVQREAYFTDLAVQQQRKVDQELAAARDPRMPLYDDRRSKVSFGPGN